MVFHVLQQVMDQTWSSGIMERYIWVLGVVWFILWGIFVAESPETHPTISVEEKKLILDSQKNAASHVTTPPIPWFRIFSSIRVWAIVVAAFSNNWVLYLVLTGLPSYFRQVMNVKLSENGLISALPFLASFTVCLASGYMADFLSRRWLNITQVRRLAGILAYYPAAIFLVLASYTTCNQVALSVTYMVLATGFMSFNNAGYNVNHLDISPRFCGVLVGITNTVGTVAGCITPSVTGYFTNDHPTRVQYRKVFILAAAVSVVGGTFYNLFVTGIQQDWNDVEQKDKDVEGRSNAAIENDHL